MKQHKWHKEIKAWADGEEIEFRYKDRYLGDEWELVEVLNDFGEEFEYRIKPQPKTPKQAWDEELTRSYKETIIERLRNDDKFYDEVFSAYDNAKDNEIKPQPKEPQYLYVWLDKDEDRIEFDHYPVGDVKEDAVYRYIGKIKLEVEDGN